jgi:starch phosphorylase
VSVVQVDGSGLPDTPEIGATISLKAQIRLGDLSVPDVEVQAVIGRVTPGEELTDVVTFPMTHFGSEDGVDIFEAEVALPVSGSVGYTVRVLPHHRLLVNASELGLVTTPLA